MSMPTNIVVDLLYRGVSADGNGAPVAAWTDAELVTAGIACLREVESPRFRGDERMAWDQDVLMREVNWIVDRLMPEVLHQGNGYAFRYPDGKIARFTYFKDMPKPTSTSPDFTLIRTEEVCS